MRQRTVTIESLQAGLRVLTFTPEDRARNPATIAPIHCRLHKLTLYCDRGSGSSVLVTLLRSPDWIADYGAHVGGTVWLNMPEMGIEGEAEVLDIGPELLRPLWWLEERNVQVGGRIDINVSECGIDGYAKLLYIGACPSIEHDPIGRTDRGDPRLIRGFLVRWYGL